MARAQRGGDARASPAGRLAARFDVASRLWENTASLSPASGFTHTAATSRSEPTSASAMVPSATASITPDATPAWAAPQVRPAWRSLSMEALFTKRVKGRTATPGATEATKATCPARGVAKAVTQAVSTGPPTAPSTVFTCAASAPCADEGLAELGAPSRLGSAGRWRAHAGRGQVSGGSAKGSVRP